MSIIHHIAPPADHGINANPANPHAPAAAANPQLPGANAPGNPAAVHPPANRYITVMKFLFNMLAVVAFSFCAYHYSYVNLGNMSLYVSKQGYTESFLGLWLLPLQERFPESIASLILAAKDPHHGNVWDALASTTLSGVMSLGFTVPRTILPIIE